jgi:hypothetical protein
MPARPESINAIVPRFANRVDGVERVEKIGEVVLAGLASGQR